MLVFNKHSSGLKLNPERAVEIPEYMYLVQNFTPVLMAQRLDLCLFPFGGYLGLGPDKR